MSIGIYAFVTPDWEQKDYPLGPWLQWHSQYFDEISIVTAGDMEIPYDADNIRINSYPFNRNYMDIKQFATMKQTAQGHLKTGWKVMMDVDEFIYRPDTSNLDTTGVYPLTYIHLWGSLDYQIQNTGFPVQQIRGQVHGCKPLWALHDCKHTRVAHQCL